MVKQVRRITIIKIFVLLVMLVSVWTQTIVPNVFVVKTLIALIVTITILSATPAILPMALTLKILELVCLALTRTVLNASRIMLTAKFVCKTILNTQAIPVAIVK